MSEVAATQPSRNSGNHLRAKPEVGALSPTGNSENGGNGMVDMPGVQPQIPVKIVEIVWVLFLKWLPLSRVEMVEILWVLCLRWQPLTRVENCLNSGNHEVA